MKRMRGIKIGMSMSMLALTVMGAAAAAVTTTPGTPGEPVLESPTQLLAATAADPPAAPPAAPTAAAVAPPSAAPASPAAPAAPAAPASPAPPDASPAAAPASPAPPDGALYAVHESERGPVLLGEVVRADLIRHFPGWADTASAYVPDLEAVAVLAAVDRDVTVTCVLGTWCSDSRREVPRFWKVLDLAANPRLSLRMLAVGRRDDDAAQARLVQLGFDADIRGQYGVEYVPTFIFSETGDGSELGRIIESPAATLERDAAAILLVPAAPDHAPAQGWR